MPTPDELIRTVTGSHPDDWVKVAEWYVNGGHDYRCVYRQDADLSIEWGMEAADELHFDWVRFPDRRVSAFFFDVLWRGGLVFRERVLLVDGARAYLPLPSPAFGPEETLEPEGHRMVLGEVVTESRLARARLLDDMVHGHTEWEGQTNFEHYWE
jgi:hypothetical protein